MDAGEGFAPPMFLAYETGMLASLPAVLFIINNYMKIIVLGAARTGSTKLCSVLAKVCSLTNLGELIQYRNLSDYIGNLQRVNYLPSQDNVVAKFAFVNFQRIGLFNPINLNSVDWNSPDIVISAHRDNLVDRFVSHMVALERNVYHGKTSEPITPITINHRVVDEWVSYHAPEVTNQLLTTIQSMRKKPIHRITYDEICDDTQLLTRVRSLGITTTCDISIPLSATGIDYRLIVNNYAEIEQEFAVRGLL